jgi:hypothetical protein
VDLLRGILQDEEAVMGEGQGEMMASTEDRHGEAGSEV